MLMPGNSFYSKRWSFTTEDLPVLVGTARPLTGSFAGCLIEQICRKCQKYLHVEEEVDR